MSNPSDKPRLDEAGLEHIISLLKAELSKYAKLDEVGEAAGIKSIEQTTTSTADGGINTITVTMSNDDTATFSIRNGSKGSTGATGPEGPQGPQGNPGYSPVRGTDYWTEADKAEIKTYVDDAILGGAW